MNIEKDIPTIVLQRIFFHLDIHDLLRCQSVCMRWYNAANTDNIWYPLAAIHNLMKFDKFFDLSLHSSLEVGSAPNGLSPEIPITFFTGSQAQLGIPCKWKQVFIRGTWLQDNWKRFRYTVGPVLTGHKYGKITAMDCDSFIIATGGDDKLVNVYELATCQLLYTLSDHPEAITALQIAENKTLLTACADGQIRLFDSEYGMLQTFIDCSSPIEFMKVTKLREASTIVPDTSLAQNQVPLSKYEKDEKEPQNGHQRVDKNIVICAMLGSGHLQLWRMHDCTLINEFRLHVDDIEFLDIHEKFILTGGWDKRVCVVNKRRGTLDARLTHDEGVLCATMLRGANAGDLVYTGSCEGKLRVWSVNAERRLAEWNAHKDEVYCLAGAANRLATGGADGLVKLWDIEDDHALLACHARHVGIVRHIFMDGARVISAGDRKKITLWNHTMDCPLRSEEETRRLKFIPKRKRQQVANGVNNNNNNNNNNNEGGDHNNNNNNNGDNGEAVVREDAELKESEIEQLDKKVKHAQLLHRQPILINHIFINETRIVTASPEKPSKLTILSFW